MCLQLLQKLLSSNQIGVSFARRVSCFNGSCQMGYSHTVGNVEVRVATSYPSTGIEGEHFVLDFSPIRLKWRAPESK